MDVVMLSVRSTTLTTCKHSLEHSYLRSVTFGFIVLFQYYLFVEMMYCIEILAVCVVFYVCGIQIATLHYYQ